MEEDVKTNQLGANFYFSFRLSFTIIVVEQLVVVPNLVVSESYAAAKSNINVSECHHAIEQTTRSFVHSPFPQQKPSPKSSKNFR